MRRVSFCSPCSHALEPTHENKTQGWPGGVAGYVGFVSVTCSQTVVIITNTNVRALVGLIMKCVYLDALSNEGDYSYNTVPMFTWIVVEGTLVAIAASVPLLRPLMRHMGNQQTQASNSYDLPRYAIRSGHTDSSGVSKFGTIVRTSVKGGGPSMGGSPRTLYPLDSDSEEGFLVLQKQGTTASPETSGPRNCRIVVRQEYTVTSEAKKEGQPHNEDAGIDMVAAQHVHTRRPSSSDHSTTSIGEPRLPASVWSRGRA